MQDSTPLTAVKIAASKVRNIMLEIHLQLTWSKSLTQLYPDKHHPSIVCRQNSRPQDRLASLSSYQRSSQNDFRPYLPGR